MSDSTIHDLPAAATVSATDVIPIDQGLNTVKATVQQMAAVVGPINVGIGIHNANTKATPADPDEMGLVDSADGNTLKKFTWANLKTTLLAYFSALTGTWSISITGNAATATTATKLQTARNLDVTNFDGTADVTIVAPAIHAAPSKTTPVTADEIGIWDNVTQLLNKVTFANLSSFFGASATYTPAGTGAIQTTVQARMRDHDGQISGVSKTDLLVYDDFDCADTVLNGRTTATGQTWSVSGPGSVTASVTNNLYTSDLNAYASLNYGQQIKYIAGVFSYIKSVGTVAYPGAILIAQDSTANLGTMLHLQLQWDSWFLQKRIGGGAFIGIAIGNYKLDWDGTPYRAAMRIVGNTVTVETPDGQYISVTDTDIGSMTLTVGTWQITGGGSTGVLDVRWHNVVMGGNIQSKLPIMDGATAPGEVYRVAGVGYGKRTSETYTITSAGIYRIAYNSPGLPNYSIFGNLKLRMAGLVYDFIDFNVDATAPATSVIIVNHMGGGYHLTSVRAGSDADAVFVDVIIANITSPLNLEVTAEGDINLYPKAIFSPATPANFILQNISTVQQTVFNYTYNTTGWTRLASTAGGPGGFLMEGIIRIKAYDAGRAIQMDLAVGAVPGGFYCPLSISNLTGLNTPITQIRLTRDSGLNEVGLDVYCAYAGTNIITIEAEYYGFFTPPGTLVVATTLATETVISNITINYNIFRRLINYPDRDDTISIITPVDGGTTSMTNQQTALYIFAAPLANYTVDLPTNPLSNEIVTFWSINGITNFTVTAEGTYTLAPGQTIKFLYYAGLAAWLKIQ